VSRIAGADCQSAAMLAGEYEYVNRVAAMGAQAVANDVPTRGLRHWIA
jgi:hypothetical protein